SAFTRAVGGRVQVVGDDFLVSDARSEEHTSELQSLPTISYAVFCLKKKNIILLHFSIAISRLSNETKILAQEVARLDLELRSARGEYVFFLIGPGPPGSTRLVTLFPYTTLFR